MMTGSVFGLLQGAAEEGGFDINEMILHHLADSKYLELPGGKEILLPQFAPLHLGPITLDFSITKHVFWMMVAALLTIIIMLYAASKAKREHASGAHSGPKGTTNVVEAIILYIRDEVALRNVGHHGEGFVPYIVAVFFFIFFCNALGLLPWGASPTGNVSVTAALAIMTFIVVEVAGMRALGPKGYAKTIFYIPPGMKGPLAIIMLIIMTPVELLSKLTKPFALTIRLYANMTAGHAVVLSLTGLAVMASLAGKKFLVIAVAPVIMATAIMVLEIFVAVLQAYIFAMLSAVFIGLIRHEH